MSGFQKIYELALRRPVDGYVTSPRFEQTPTKCPKCKGTTWAFRTTGGNHVIGVTCEDCPWLHTYHLLDDEPEPPEQPELFTSEVVHPPGVLSRTDRFERSGH